jgi:hypothetical protein
MISLSSGERLQPTRQIITASISKPATGTIVRIVIWRDGKF